jgi:hypothetical protein
MALQQNGKGSVTYKCRHRGEGCDQPARSTKGLVRAAVFGLSLLGRDERLQDAIRRRLAGGTRAAPGRARRGRRPAPAEALGALSAKRRSLLDLFYTGNISAEGFKEEEDRLLLAIEAAREQAALAQANESAQNDLELRFEQVASIL